MPNHDNCPGVLLIQWTIVREWTSRGGGGGQRVTGQQRLRQRFCHVFENAQRFVFPISAKSVIKLLQNRRSQPSVHNLLTFCEFLLPCKDFDLIFLHFYSFFSSSMRRHSKPVQIFFGTLLLPAEADLQSNNLQWFQPHTKRMCLHVSVAKYGRGLLVSLVPQRAASPSWNNVE